MAERFHYYSCDLSFLFVLTLPLADPLQRLLLLHVILSTQGETSFYLFSNILASFRWPRHKGPFI